MSYGICHIIHLIPHLYNSVALNEKILGTFNILFFNNKRRITANYCFHSGTGLEDDQLLQVEVHDALNEVLGGPEFFKEDAISPYFHHIGTVKIHY